MENQVFPSPPNQHTKMPHPVCPCNPKVPRFLRPHPPTLRLVGGLHRLRSRDRSCPRINKKPLMRSLRKSPIRCSPNTRRRSFPEHQQEKGALDWRFGGVAGWFGGLDCGLGGFPVGSFGSHSQLPCKNPEMKGDQLWIPLKMGTQKGETKKVNRSIRSG